MQKKAILMTLMIFAAGLLFFGCAHDAAQRAMPGMVAPTVTLELFEVPQYDGYWYFGKNVAPTKGEAGDRGAPLPMSFLFSVNNPNPYPVQLSDYKFTVAFDGDFELVTVANMDTIWIPGGKTSHVRATTMITARSALLSLMVTGGFKLKDKGWSPWDALERWWKGVPDYSVPVSVKEGAFTFSADGKTMVVPFETVYP